MGGLTVLARAARAPAAADRYLYLGDTARAAVRHQVARRRSALRAPPRPLPGRARRQAAGRRLQHGERAALDGSRRELAMPVLGVLEPGRARGGRARGGPIGRARHRGDGRRAAPTRAPSRALDPAVEVPRRRPARCSCRWSRRAGRDGEVAARASPSATSSRCAACARCCSAARTTRCSTAGARQGAAGGVRSSTRRRTVAAEARALLDRAPADRGAAAATCDTS